MMPSRIEIQYRRIGPWEVPIAWTAAYRWPLYVHVSAEDGVFTQGHKTQGDWQQKIATAVTSERDRKYPDFAGSWSGRWSLSIALSLQRESQGRDVDNFAKPIVDAVADGLGFPDDSCFKTLFVHVISEHAGITGNDGPGVAICVAQDLTT